MLAKIAILTTIGLCFGLASHAQTDYLGQVDKLQETARKSNGGALGCGDGSIVLVTTNGEIRVGVGLDPIHVFGRKVVISDLVALLQARADYNRTGKQNPMSGRVSDLAYVILSTLALSKDATVIPIIAELLDDDDEVIRGWSAIALIRLAKYNEELQEEIEKITFPSLSIQSAKGRGEEIPAWVRTRS